MTDVNDVAVEVVADGPAREPFACTVTADEDALMWVAGESPVPCLASL
jgi:hypothetical protein